MQVDSVVNTSGAGTGTEVLKTEEPMGKDAFLKLLVTQLQNQDPLNPTENTEFVAQLAQFSSLEGITNLDKSMVGMSSTIASMENYNTANLIGRGVKVGGSVFEYTGNSPASIGYDLGAGASQVLITISDRHGGIVRSVAPAPGPEGEQLYSWNGLDDNGTAVAPGVYNFTVRAIDGAGKTVAAAPFVIEPVRSVDFSEGDARLVIGGMTISKDEIKAIY